MRHKTLSCHPRNYQLDSLTLLKGVHPPIFLTYLMGTVSVMKTDIKKCDNTALTTYFYIVRAVLSLKFETIYRIERYVCNPIFLLIIIHGDAIGLL